MCGAARPTRTRLCESGGVSYIYVVKIALALLLIALQLRPLAGAVVCLHAATTNDPQCAMPMPDRDPDPAPAHHTDQPATPTQAPGHGCPASILCAAPTTAVLPLVNLLAIVPPAERTAATLLPISTPTDPTAPPAPPPNA